mmetsp:Transcript_38814/g.123341  ORF Transcript_38814/g.123341 Transcript_38814/m.123341 type:complete len:236 (+) Transcript_38814:1408-2115(+)
MQRDVRLGWVPPVLGPRVPDGGGRQRRGVLVGPRAASLRRGRMRDRRPTEVCMHASHGLQNLTKRAQDPRDCGKSGRSGSLAKRRLEDQRNARHRGADMCGGPSSRGPRARVSGARAGRVPGEASRAPLWVQRDQWGVDMAFPSGRRDALRREAGGGAGGDRTRARMRCLPGSVLQPGEGRRPSLDHPRQHRGRCRGHRIGPRECTGCREGQEPPGDGGRQVLDDGCSRPRHRHL